MIKTIPYLFAVVLLFTGCKTRTNELDVPGYELGQGKVKVSDEAMNDIIENLSSPVEMAALIKDLGVPYSNRYLTSLDEIDNYNTAFRMAFNLGMLGADLGYLNVYNKTGNAVSYLSEINRLSDGLKVSQFFDFSTIKRLATSNSNLDSLMFLSVRSFNQMDEHLRETDRSNLSVLMVAGIWIEGMYLATQVAEEKPDKELAEYIGEQKLILNDLLLILKNYERDEQFKKLISEFETIRKAFRDVKITYVMGEPKAIEKDGMFTVVPQESSVITISPETVRQIEAATSKVRNRQLTM
ncbi:MAG TPA: hypothetical protein VE870_08735 [Bacteroidales bacterium]|nr:hypothetical protein [Bacteroidales bacterium]